MPEPTTKLYSNSKGEQEFETARSFQVASSAIDNARDDNSEALFYLDDLPIKAAVTATAAPIAVRAMPAWLMAMML